MNLCLSLIVVLLHLTSTALVSAATDNNANIWLNYFGDHRLNDSPWSLHLDSQVRRADFGKNWQQFLIQPGVNYNLTDKITTSAGYGYMETDRYGDFPIPFDLPEHRIWEQISIPTKLLGVTWQHRFRMEQRFLGTPIASAPPVGAFGFRYENRFRYRLQTFAPLDFLNLPNGYFRCYDELFFNVGQDVAKNDFDQNRAYIGLGCSLGSHLGCEIGFMEQTLQHRDGVVWENNHTLMISLTSKAIIKTRNRTQ